MSIKDITGRFIFMKILRTILVLLLGITIGVLGTIAGIVGGGYYIVTYVTPEQAESIVQGFVPDFALPETFPEQFLTMTIMELINEVVDIAGNLDTLSLNDLQERLGYEIPLKFGDDKDLTFLFAPIMDIPIKEIPNNMNLVVDNLSLNSLVMLGILDENNLPSLPMFNDPEAMNQSLMGLFGGLGAFKISDVVSLYTGDYYPDNLGMTVLLSPVFIDYDSTNPLHKDLTRYKQGYVVDENGDYVRIDNEYVAYNSSDHSGMLRYNPKMLPSFGGDKVLHEPVFESYDPSNPAHLDAVRYAQPDRSPDVLLALGSSYINAVPESDPEGMIISDTLNTLQVKDIINTEGGSAILLALQDAYIGNSAPASDPEGKTIAETIDTLQISQVIDIYEEDVYEEGTGNLLHAKSNQVLIAIKDAYIGSNPPEGGLTINDTINTLKVEDIMDITPYNIYDNDGQLISEQSTQILIAIREAYIGTSVPASDPTGKTISEIVETLQIKDVMNIYTGEEYIVDGSGDYVVDGFIAYDEFNPDHDYLVRFDYTGDEYLVDDNGDWVLNYIDYDPLLHSDWVRYNKSTKSSKVLVALKDAYIGDNPAPGGLTISQTLDALTLGEIIDIDENSTQILQELKDTTINDLDSTLNSLKLKQTMTIYTEDIFDIEGQLVQAMSNLVLISLQDAYIGSVPAEDPSGLSLSDTLDNLTISELIVIYDGTEYVSDDLGDYYRIPAEYELYDELVHIGLPLYRFNDTNNAYYPDDEGDYAMIMAAQYVLNTDPLYIDFTTANPANPPLPTYKLADPSSNLITSLAASTLNSIDNDINDLELGQILTITESSSKVLQSLKDTTLNGLDARIQTFRLNEVINIYDGDEYIVNDIDGEYVIWGYEPYDEFNSKHSHLTRYTYDGFDYIEDELGDWVDNYVVYDEFNPNHNGLTRYSHPTPSPLMLRSIKDAEINNLDATINDLQLKDVIEITPSSSKILRALEDVYIGSSAPPGEMTLNEKILTLTFEDVVDIYEQDEYYLDPLGLYVFTYIDYDPSNPDHLTLERWVSDGMGGYLLNNHSGAYVIYYTLHNDDPIYDGLDRWSFNAKSSQGLIAMKDTNINNIDGKLTTLKLRDVQIIYDGHELYHNNTGSWIKEDGVYELYDDIAKPHHKHLQRYSYDGINYNADDLGDYVELYRPALTPDEDNVFPRYAFRPASSKFLRSMADSNLTDMGFAMDSLTIGDMIDITDSSPKIMHAFKDSSLMTLESTVNDLQLKDVIDVYSDDVYIDDDNGYFVFVGGEYIEYDELVHASEQRLTRSIGISDDNKAYAYTPSGDYVLILGTPDEYLFNDTFDPLYDDLPRYDLKGDKSSNLMIKLKDAYIYNAPPGGENLINMLDNLTIIDVLGDPAPGSLMEAISYEDDGVTPVKITGIEARTTQVMQSATLEELAEWGIFDNSGFSPAQWDGVKDLTIQQFINYAILFMP